MANGKRRNALTDECGGVAPGDPAPTVLLFALDEAGIPPETGEGGGGMPGSSGFCTLGSSRATQAVRLPCWSRWRDRVDKNHREATGRGRE